MAANEEEGENVCDDDRECKRDDGEAAEESQPKPAGGAIAILFVSLTGASPEIEKRRREAPKTLVGTLTILASVIDKHDRYTAGHSKRVATYSRLLALELRLPPDACDTIEHAALMHDLGKIGIPDAVLLKPAALTESERLVIGSHPTIGADIIRTCGTMDDVVACVLHHHSASTAGGIPISYVPNRFRAARASSRCAIRSMR